jgi:uncharacterized Ntn-hydrolase superfamily protein
VFRVGTLLKIPFISLHLVTKEDRIRPRKVLMTKYFIIPLISLGFLLPYAHATYSIVACDAETRQCGVAVQTNNLAVGASVPYAKAGVGALASQFETNPNYGPRGLGLLASGKSPEETLKQLLSEDGNFDGQGIEARQVGIVSMDGRAAFYTGEDAANSSWAGGRSGKGYSIQGNGLASAVVIDAMEQAFLKTPGALADRLLAALSAGDAAGGQKTGRESAVLLVRTPDGFPMDLDLRVDHASDPVAELRQLYNMQAARQQVIQASIAARKGQFDEARTLMIAAVARASSWQRIWIRAAQVAESIEQRQLALQDITVAFAQNPAWAPAEIGSGKYAELGASPLFHRWVSAEQEQQALSSYQQARQAKQVTSEKRAQVSRILLEAGHPKEALTLLNDSPEISGASVDLQLLRAEADAATGNYTAAMEQCREAAAKAPHNLRVGLRMAELDQRAAALRKSQ